MHPAKEHHAYCDHPAVRPTAHPSLLLRASCPPHLKVVLAPFAVALVDDTEVQPDLLVAPREQFTRKELPGPPLLAVEVLSPSTRRFDLLLDD